MVNVRNFLHFHCLSLLIIINIINFNLFALHFYFIVNITLIHNDITQIIRITQTNFIVKYHYNFLN